jgi:DNA-binding NarL/FixJ family response regulator
MPVMGGVETISALRKILPEVKIIILTMYGKDSIAREALRAGAHGYILKGDPGETLVEGIEAVLQGRYFFSEQIQSTLVDFFRQPENESFLPEEQKYNSLSDREKQVFRLLMEGKSTIEISRMLEVSQKTGEKHRTSIVKKLGTNNPVEMFKYAIRIGLVDPDSLDQ